MENDPQKEMIPLIVGYFDHVAEKIISAIENCNKLTTSDVDPIYYQQMCLIANIHYCKNLPVPIDTDVGKKSSDLMKKLIYYRSGETQDEPFYMKYETYFRTVSTELLNMLEINPSYIDITGFYERCRTRKIKEEM